MKKAIDFFNKWRVAEKNETVRKAEIFVAGAVTLALCLCLVYRIWISIHENWNSEWAYHGFSVADFMINYEGGFVRRGIMGQILLWLFQIHPFVLHHVVYGFEIFLTILLCVLTYFICKRMKWFPILPLAIVIGIFHYRRDFMMLMLAFEIFNLLFKHITSKKKSFLIFSILITDAALLIYEPCFFYIVPLSIIIYWTSVNGSFFCRVRQCLKVFATPLLVMAVIVVFGRGSVEKEEIIWESWQPLFEHIDAKYKPDEIPGAINFLGRSSRQTMLTHLNQNYRLDTEQSLDFVSGSLIMMLCCWFLTMNIPCRNVCERKKRIMLSSVFLFLLACHLPMLTVLSCDLGRTMYSLIFPSLFVVYLSSKYSYDFEIPILGKMSRLIYDDIASIPAVNTIWFYLFALFMMPFTFCCGVSINRNLYIEYQELFHSMAQLFTSL